jgi:hypothetical protein
MIHSKGEVMKKNGQQEGDLKQRRNFLKATSAAFVAASVPATARATLRGSQSKEDEVSNNRSRPIYLYGCGWNRELPGTFGELCLTFDMSAHLGGTGLGTFRDDVHPEFNSQFQINSARNRGNEYTFEGEIIRSANRGMIGMRVRIDAESLGDGTARATLMVETSGNLVVIAIIAILIGMLIPAVQ